MEIELILKNYRCFPDSRPARIKIQKGFIAFVGANNSGKSSLLKFFYEFRSIFYILMSPEELTQSLNGNLRSFNWPFPIQDPSEVFCNANHRDLEICICLIPDISMPTRPSLDLSLIVHRPRNQFSSKIAINKQPVQTSNMLRQENVLYLQKEPVVDLSPLIEVFKAFSNTLYIGPFRNVLNLASEDPYFDIQVGQEFIKQWHSWKTGHSQLQNEAAYSIEESLGKIFGFSNLQINASYDQKTLRMFENSRSYRLDQFGSGLTQFFLVLTQAAMRTPSFILIDEPELNLHASLQLDFLTTLTSYATEGILFATHSMGLARASTNQIYSLRRNADGLSEVHKYDATPRLSEFLGELGFAGYKELGFDKILLVEGATEVKTFHQFLRLYGKDHQIVLLPLGGSQLIRGVSETELQEIKRISANISAVIDSERASPHAALELARVSFLQVCKNVNIDCCVLDRRATENYFTDQAIKKVKGSKYSALQPYERLGDASFGWAKADNWRIAREMSREELDTTDLGEFLQSL